VFELHAHSSERSLDSGVRAAVIAEQAAWRGLDGVCLTEHNALWPAAEIRELSERFEITLLAGMELGTDCGHVLVYGLPRYHPELLQLETLRRIVESEGAAMVMAHPMRPFHGPRPGLDELNGWFDGIEAINGDHSDSEHGYLIRQAVDVGVAALGGSDVHSRDAVGRCATAFALPVAEVHDIAELIRNLQVWPVDFRPRPSHIGQSHPASREATGR
jgi:predicted metal-dependent phosphoesterase TrpH